MHHPGGEPEERQASGQDRCSQEVSKLTFININAEATPHPTVRSIQMKQLYAFSRKSSYV